MVEEGVPCPSRNPGREFAAAELGARIGRSLYAAAQLIADVLDLVHRRPVLWGRVQAGEVRASYARHVVSKTRDLSPDQAAHVDAAVAESADGRIRWSRFETLVEGAVAAANPAAAQEKEEQAAQATFAKKLRTEAQRDHLGPEELRAELRRIGPRAAKGRRRTPGFVRRMRLPEPQVVNGAPEHWSIGYLTDVILTRDPWMHRLDLARATGQAPTLTADHDGVIVADVVLEWARRHGRPYRLELTGPAGGRWSSGTGGEEIVMDAADFCRVVAGRPGPAADAPSGLLGTQIPF